MTPTAITITKFNGSNYKQWSCEMVLLLEQMQVHGIVTGEDKKPKDAVEDANPRVKLAQKAAIKEWEKQHGTARSTILLGMEPRLRTSYMEINDARILWEKLAAVYRSKSMFNVIKIREELSQIRLEDCGDVETYALRIERKVKEYNLCSEPSSDVNVKTLAKMSDEEHVFYLLRGIPRNNDDWKVIFDLMMGMNAAVTLTPGEIVIKLAEKEATIKRENGLDHGAILLSKKGSRKKGRGNENDTNDTRACYVCQTVGHIARFCPKRKKKEDGHDDNKVVFELGR